MADVFISYRRGEGAELARLMQLRLRERRINAFLDVDDLRPGQFDEALLAEIESAPSFLLILTKGALDRCSSDDDWLRREITHALRQQKNVVPLFTSGFTFPPETELPPELRPIVVHQGVSYSHEFLDAVVDKIVSYLDTRSSITATSSRRSASYERPAAREAENPRSQSSAARLALAVADSDAATTTLTLLALAVAVGLAITGVTEANYFLAILASVCAVAVTALFLVNTFYGGWGPSRMAVTFLPVVGLAAAAGYAFAQMELPRSLTAGLIVLGCAAAVVLIGTYLYYAGWLLPGLRAHEPKRRSGSTGER